MISSPIIPAIIPKSVADIEAFLLRLPKVPEFHVDVVDGVFVPAVSWPYMPTGTPTEVANILAAVTLEVDLMVANPLRAAYDWIHAGADMLVFHSESAPIEIVREIGTTTGVTIGIASNNDTPFSVLAEYFPYVDYVQVMGISTIGAQGCPFDDRALTRIRDIRALQPGMHISLDGSVNATTLPNLLSEMLDRYIVGSAVYAAEDPLHTYTHFTELASAQALHSRGASVGIL